MIESMIKLLIPFLITVESSGNDSAVGDHGRAVGCLQIHVQVIEDVNRVYKTKFTDKDRLDRAKSIEICSLYLCHWAEVMERNHGKGVSLQDLARIWNGGPKGYHKEATVAYWCRVEKMMMDTE